MSRTDRPLAALTRTVLFRASHRYGRSDWTDAANAEAFGELTVPHPHDYRVDVTVEGAPDPTSGFVVDLVALDRVLEARVRGPLHGRLLNEAVPEFRDGRIQPSCEALACWIAERIGPHVPPPAHLRAVRVAESEVLAAEVRWTA